MGADGVMTACNSSGHLKNAALAIPESEATRLRLLRTAAVLVLLSAWSAWSQTAELGPAPIAPDLSALLESQLRGQAPRALAPGELWFWTNDRQAVRDFYKAVFEPTASTPMGWTGSIAGCVAGDTSQGYKDAVVTRINWFRAMAGVPAVVALDPVRNRKAQQAALMMSANRALNHTPPPSWNCYTPEGSEAAGRSNLCSGFEGWDDPGCVKLYMIDHGGGNAAVGHRRWILYPQATVMGTGDVGETVADSQNYPSANALWVIPDSWPPRPATRDDFVAWPPPGFVPYSVVPARWSFSYPGADFSSALVTMTVDGRPMSARLEPVAVGYGENTLVWVAGDLDPNVPTTWPRPATDQVVRVQVTGVRIGAATRSFDYQVVIFDPDATGVNQAPQPTALDPASGTGLRQSFTFTFSDPDGWQDLTVVNGLINFWLDGRQACYFAYVPAQRALYLVDDAGNAGGPYAGMLLPSTAAISNGQCTIYGSGSIVSADGQTLSLTLDVAFHSNFGGTKIVYLAARDRAGHNSGWQRLGVWSVPGQPPANPAPTSASPTRGTGLGPATFTFQFSQNQGWQQLDVVNVLINDWLDGRNACYIAYSRPLGVLYLVNDQGTALLPGLVAGSSASVSNNQCTLYGAGSSVSGSGTTLTLMLKLGFSPWFAGNRVLYLAARDLQGGNSGWQAMGTWTVR
jgi:hypothetical protein